jgi:hypothetical protein
MVALTTAFGKGRASKHTFSIFCFQQLFGTCSACLAPYLAVWNLLCLFGTFSGCLAPALAVWSPDLAVWNLIWLFVI